MSSLYSHSGEFIGGHFGRVRQALFLISGCAERKTRAESKKEEKAILIVNNIKEKVR